MPFTFSATSGITGFETNEQGYMTRGRINSVPTTGLDTTASLYAVGCKIIDSSTSLEWMNVGTVAAPSWIVAGPSEGFVQVTVAAGQIPLLYGGTNVQLLPPPPLGASQAYVLNGWVLEYVGAGGTVFTGGGSTVRIVYGSAGTNVAAYMNIGTATFVSGTTTKTNQGLVSPAQAGQSVIPGMGLFMDNTTAAYAGGGTSSMKVSLWYSVIPV